MKKEILENFLMSLWKKMKKFEEQKRDWIEEMVIWVRVEDSKFIEENKWIWKISNKNDWLVKEKGKRFKTFCSKFWIISRVEISFRKRWSKSEEGEIWIKICREN